MKDIKIGILGGMGPRATILFEQTLIDLLPGTDQQIPTIITINDGSIPDRTKFILEGGADPVPNINQNLQSLECLGCKIICLPCNTACSPEIFSRLTPSYGTKVLNLPEEVANTLLFSRFDKTLLLATSGTIQSQSFSKACQKSGIKLALPDTKQQRIIDETIRSIKLNDRLKLVQQIKLLRKIISLSNADSVILGCTELPMIKNELIMPNVTLIDTLEVLAVAASNQFQQLNTVKVRKSR